MSCTTLKPKRRADALDAPVNDDEAVERQELEAIDHGLLAGAGHARDADEGRAHLAVLQGEVEKGLEHARTARGMPCLPFSRAVR